MITVRTSGLLAYYAQTHGMRESDVVEAALSSHLRGYRISAPGEPAGQDGAAA